MGLLKGWLYALEVGVVGGLRGRVQVAQGSGSEAQRHDGLEVPRSQAGTVDLRFLRPDFRIYVPGRRLHRQAHEGEWALD